MMLLTKVYSWPQKILVSSGSAVIFLREESICCRNRTQPEYLLDQIALFMLNRKEGYDWDSHNSTKGNVNSKIYVGINGNCI